MKNVTERKQQLLKNALRKDITGDLYGSLSVQQLLYDDTKREAANKQLTRIGKWFSLPHPNGRDLHGEPDFAALRLVWAIYLCDDLMTEETKSSIFDFFTKWDFESKYKSENHMLIFHVSRYMAAQAYEGAMFTAYDKTSEVIFKEDENFIKDFLCFRAKRGWAEFDSCGYGGEIAACLMTLMEFAHSNEIVTLARNVQDLQILDMIADSLGAIYGGAHGRIYADAAFDYAKSAMFVLYHVFFDSGYSEKVSEAVSLELALSSYIPSDFVYEAMASKPTVYENYESKHLHCIGNEIPHKQVPQVEGSINKYTYVTSNYVIGAVNFQDDYPKDSEAKWYAHHEQHEWDLSLKGDTDIKIFSHHPGSYGTEGHEHGYWTGDMQCCCGNFYCEKNTLIAMYDIPENEDKWIHAHVPFSYFEMEKYGNYLFLKREGVCVSLWFSEGYEIVEEGQYAGQEVKSYGKRHGVVCRVSDTVSYEDFVDYNKKNVPVFEKEEMTLTCDGLYMDKEKRCSNGRQVAFPYPTYDSPILYEAFGSGNVVVKTKNGDTTLYFE